MQNDYNTLKNYFSLVDNHIKQITDFNLKTNELLTNPTISDLFFENNQDDVSVEISSVKVKHGISQKIIFIIKELANKSQLYLEELISHSKILEEFIRFINSKK